MTSFVDCDEFMTKENLFLSLLKVFLRLTLLMITPKNLCKMFDKRKLALQFNFMFGCFQTARYNDKIRYNTTWHLTASHAA